MQKTIIHLKLTNASFLEFMTLKVLASRTYSIDEIVELLAMKGFKPPLGSIYPLFTILRRNAYVTTGREESDEGGSLTTYQLTEKGRAHLTDLRSDWKRLSSAIASL